MAAQLQVTEQRVRGGALDYRSGERLSTLHMLRRIASTPAEVLAQEAAFPMIALDGSLRGVDRGSCRGRADAARSITNLERQARRESHGSPGLVCHLGGGAELPTP